MMLGLLMRGLSARAEELASWYSGDKVQIKAAPLGRFAHDAVSDSGGAVEFRFDLFGPCPTTYVVTITEVRGKP